MELEHNTIDQTVSYGQPNHEIILEIRVHLKNMTTKTRNPTLKQKILNYLKKL